MNLWWVAPLVWAAPVDLDAERDRIWAMDVRFGELYRAGELKEAEVLAREALAERERLFADDAVELAYGLNNLAVLLEATGEPGTAGELYKRALSINEEQLGREDIRIVTNLVNVAQWYLKRGDAAAALPLYERVLAIQEEAHGVDHPDTVVALDTLGVVFGRLGRFLESVNSQARVVAILEQAHGRDHPVVAQKLGDLAAGQIRVGQYDEAKAALTRSISVLEGAMGPDHGSLARPLAAAGKLARAQGEYNLARQHYMRLLKLEENAFGPEDSRVGLTLNSLGVLMFDLGDLQGAEVAFEKSHRILVAALGEAHPETTRPVNGLATAAKDRGDWARARELYRAVLDLRRSALGAHPDTATALTNLGTLDVLEGDLGAARSAFEEALQIREQTVGTGHSDYANDLGNLSTLLRRQGDFLRAQRLAEQVHRIYVDIHGPDHPSVADALNALGVLQLDLGDKDRAERSFLRARDILETALGAEHIALASPLNNLAVVYLANDELELASDIYARVIELLETHHGAEHLNVAHGLFNLANVYQALSERGDEEVHAIEARRLAERALDIREAATHERHPAVAISLGQVAAVMSRGAEYDVAAQLLARALEIQESQFPSHHPHVIVTLNAIADNDRQRGEVDRGRAHRLDALERMRVFTRLIVPAMSEREALSFVAESRLTIDGILRDMNRAEDAASAWEAVLQWKGLVARVNGARGQRGEGAWEDLQHARRELARMTLAGGEGVAPKRDEVEAIERRLASENAAFRMEIARRDAIPQDVCAALLPGEVLVDYVVYAGEQETRISVFVVDSDCSVNAVDLGTAERIATSIREHRDVLGFDGSGTASTTARIDARGERLADAIWKPIAEHAKGAETLVVVPDGLVGAVSFAALPADDATYLIEHFAIAYLESASDLLRPKPAPASGALLVGDLSYGAPSEVRGCLPRDLPPLEGTRAEIDAIEKLWNRRGRRAASRLVGGGGTEEAVVAALPGNRIVHLATHGFVASKACGAGGLDPMVLSGIALADANRPPDVFSDWDGLLTAAEVSGLDLSGTELVVLSACETGLGDARAGQGVLGLRRSFAASGAQTSIMSMWAVPDNATATLMAGLYQNALHRRALSPTASLRKAQLEMLDRNRRVFGEGRPSDWAAFIAAGAWR